ncbi:MAG: hypothetical protein ACLQVL_31620 [Terriglobia bacterium]
MSPESQRLTREPFSQLMSGAMVTLAVLVAARFVLELAGMPQDFARYVSSTVGLLLVAIYVAAVGPLRGGLRKFSQLLLPSLILAAWTEGWIILATVIAAVLRISRTHFAEQEDFGNWGHLGRHVLGHTVEIGVLFVISLLLMTLVHLLWRWPITVAPGALLGVFVIMRFWTEAMGLEPLRTAAWSSTILVLLSAVYLGGVGPRVGLTEGRQLLVPSLVLGWVWRAWVFFATLLAATPFFKTHFFDPSRGDVPLRLLRALAGTVVEGFIAGLLLWGIAVGIACAIQTRGLPSKGDA